MNNNFVVSIPKELKTIKSKLFFGLTKRQLIGFGIAIAISIPVYMLIKDYNTDMAMYGLFFTAMPAVFATIYTKDGMVSETWVKLIIEYNYLNPRKRVYKVTKRNRGIAKERRMLNVKKTKPISSTSKAS